MAWGGVDDARTVLGGDIVRHDAKRYAVEDRVLEFDEVEVDAVQLLYDLIAGPTHLLGDLGQEVFQHDIVVVSDFDNGVGELGMKGYRKVGGDGPRRGSPDHRVEVRELGE